MPPARATGPRCRGGNQVFACPIDRRLRLCACVPDDIVVLLTNLSDLTISRQHLSPRPRKAVAMQHRAPSPNTQSGASVQIRAEIYVFIKTMLPFYARVS